MQEKYSDLSLLDVFVVQFVVVLATDGFIIAVAKGKLIASTNDSAGRVKAQVMCRQFHAAFDLTWGIHTVQFGANLYQATRRREYLFVAVHHQAITHHYFVFVVGNVYQRIDVGRAEELNFVN